MEKDIYNINNIRNIAEKYLEGTSTLKDEEILGQYLTSSEEIPSDLQYLKDVFIFYKNQLINETSDFNNLYDNLILKNEKSDVINSDLRNHKDKKKFSKLFYIWGSISTAAILVIAIIISVFVNKNNDKNTITLSNGTKIELVVDGKHITDPDVAIEYIQRSMIDAESAYNEAIMPAQEYFEDFYEEFYEIYYSSQKNVSTVNNRIR
ncbi:MAG: hypothetical protein ACOX4D_07840 [Bacteroidales bacterium]|jgi:hypothetical protein